MGSNISCLSLFFRFLARQPGNFMLRYELELSAKRHNDRFCLIRSLFGIAMNPICVMRVICFWERFRKFQIWLTSSNLTKWPNFRIFLENAAWKGYFFIHPRSYLSLFISVIINYSAKNSSPGSFKNIYFIREIREKI